MCKSKLPLFCQWRGDNDLADAFVRHYQSFADVHIILHGPEHESFAMMSLVESGRVKIHSKYDSQYSGREKGHRLSSAARDFVGGWVLIVDSDEFIEFPYSTIYETIEAMEAIGLSSLRAPMLQRIRHDGTLNSPEIISDPFAEFSLCSENLYRALGSAGALDKYPLFRCELNSRVCGGNHSPQNGKEERCNQIRGVTHHFKWKRTAVTRIQRMIDIGWEYAETEAVPYLRYLNQHGRLPTDDAFPYSRDELFRRELLLKPAEPRSQFQQRL